MIKRAGMLIVFLACTFLALNLLGCRILGGFDDEDGKVAGSGSTTTTTTGSITGQVTASGTIGALALPEALEAEVKAAIRARFSVNSVLVWLEEDYHGINTYTDTEGRFTLIKVPFGLAKRIVAKLTFKDANGKETPWKVRSDEIALSATEPIKAAPKMELEKCTNLVQGVYKDKDGNVVPNATLWIWGEPFTTDANGVFNAPPMPPSAKSVEIVIRGDSTFATDTQPITVTEGINTVEITGVAVGATNFPPRASLLVSKIGRVSPGETIKLWGNYFDKNTDDVARLVATWSYQNGTLTEGSESVPTELKGFLPPDLPADARVSQVSWTAPNSVGAYEIKFSVTDPAGLSVARSVVIPVGQDILPGAPNAAPTGAISGSPSVQAGLDTYFAAVASDPNGDILAFNWTADMGTFKVSTGNRAVWTAPTTLGTATITLTITDKPRDGSASLSATAKFTVSVLAAPAGTVGGGSRKITGNLYDETTKNPIAGAQVAIAGSDMKTVSDDTGYFEFVNMAPGTYDLVVARDGYAKKTYTGIVVSF